MQQNRTPISVITGFLGSGKTTLLNHLVRQKGMESTALIINEIGEVGLDHVLVESAIENTLLLENGCICCSIRGDLIDTIGDLYAKVRNGQLPKFTRILIETTGLADPVPIVQSLQTEEAIVRRCKLDLVITLVDGVQGGQQIKEYEEVVSQIAQASAVLLTKTDLCKAEALSLLKENILEINPTVTISEIEFGRIDPDDLFRSAQAEPVFADPHRHHGHDEHIHEPEHASHNHRHRDIVTCSLVHGEALDPARLRNWLAMIYSLRPYAMLRLKGLIHVRDSESPLLIQAVGGIFSPSQYLDGWPQEKPETRLVLIFRGLSPAAVRSSFRRHVID